MITLAFPGTAFSDIASTLLQDNQRESCAVATLQECRNSSGEIHRFVVRRIHIPGASDYRVRRSTQAVLKPEYVAKVTKEARQTGASLAFLHTHPFAQGAPEFSHIDDAGEQTLLSFLTERMPGRHHAAIVIGPDGSQARLLGKAEQIRIIQAGVTLDVISDARFENIAPNHERQVRAFGQNGQASLQRITVAIVGLGGTGSVVAQQLAHLGVRRFILIDPDTLDETNLNRLIGGRPSDIGIPKVVIARNHIQAIAPTAEVRAFQQNVVDDGVAQHLLHADFVFGCTDTQASRALLQQIAYQYYVPCIDVGVSITVKEQEIKFVTGRTQMLSPGLGCLTCGELLDGAVIRRELMTEEQRQADPYFVGPGEPQPAVVSINSTMTSLAVSMFLAAVAGIPGRTRFQIYDGIAGTVRAAAIRMNPMCVVCSSNGSLGQGDAWPLPLRRKP